MGTVRRRRRIGLRTPLSGFADNVFRRSATPS
jgi:hypothetical protein